MSQIEHLGILTLSNVEFSPKIKFQDPQNYQNLHFHTPWKLAIWFHIKSELHNENCKLAHWGLYSNTHAFSLIPVLKPFGRVFGQLRKPILWNVKLKIFTYLLVTTKKTRHCFQALQKILSRKNLNKHLFHQRQIFPLTKCYSFW